MELFFFCKYFKGKSCSPMLFSMFSHYSLWHLAANMFVLHSFMQPAVTTLGSEQFVFMYLGGGMLSSLTSYMYKTTIGHFGPSLGAVRIVCYHCINLLLRPNFEACLKIIQTVWTIYHLYKTVTNSHISSKNFFFRLQVLLANLWVAHGDMGKRYCGYSANELFTENLQRCFFHKFCGMPVVLVGRLCMC